MLIANRGEIANRIIQTCQTLGIQSIAVYTEQDISSTHVKNADRSFMIDSYMNTDQVISICKQENIKALHPGYGFLSENPDFSDLCEINGIEFIGPSADTVRQFGLKHTAREIAVKANVPVVPGTDYLESQEHAITEANRLGYPVMMKPIAGGGGMGIYKCTSDSEVREAFNSANDKIKRLFGQSGVYLEKYVQSPKHVEVQVFGDGKGMAIHLGERECSVQWRYQKIIEETPSPHVSAGLRKRLTDAAIQLAESVNYNNAGTAEFLVNTETDQFFFIEMNTRLQVEHAITEKVTGIDLVEWQIRQGSAHSSRSINLGEVSLKFEGHAIEARVLAEDPQNNFLPSSGEIAEAVFPDKNDARIDTWIQQGVLVNECYDPLLAKLVTHSTTRLDAINKLIISLGGTCIKGVETNIEFIQYLLQESTFMNGTYDTSLVATCLASMPYTGLTVLEPGMYTTVQDYPGRVSNEKCDETWRIGIPPSGPMDYLSFCIANLLVGNEVGAPGLEVTLSGLSILFHEECVISVCGGQSVLEKNGMEIPMWTSIVVERGNTVTIGTISTGARVYIAFSKGGLDVPDYLGSALTFPLAKFGGHNGRILAKNDKLRLKNEEEDTNVVVGKTCPEELREHFTSDWVLHVLPGPQEAPDFLTKDDMSIFYEAEWKVHYNSNRLGIRFEGPRPQWTRKHGGLGGSHPSNVLDNEYAVGTINFTGDMPIAITVDGPSLGGFVCNVTVASFDQWKFGQMRPGDMVTFQRISLKEAISQLNLQSRKLSKFSSRFRYAPTKSLPDNFPDNAILCKMTVMDGEDEILVVYRRQGDRYILVEYGSYEEESLNLNSRFRIAALEEHITKIRHPGIIETSPGVRSLQICYSIYHLSLAEVLSLLRKVELQLPKTEDMEIQSRIIKMPIVLHDRWTLEAQQLYMKSVRSEAPYLPDNLEFVARNNGLTSIDQVKEIVTSASYLVLGLGDVYLGAPCAVPLDPRHRITNPKYNPARTYTPEGAVGIGGIFMCIYPMTSPGGYQLVGRSLPIWNKYTKHPNFETGKPWLLRMFDQVQFFSVTENQLEEVFEHFRHGLYSVDIKETVLNVRHYNSWLKSIEDETARFQERQRYYAEIELRKEVEYWRKKDKDGPQSRQLLSTVTDTLSQNETTNAPDDNDRILYAECKAKIWKCLVKEGDHVMKGDLLMILEAMKMEFNYYSPCDGKVLYIIKEVNNSTVVEQGEKLIQLRNS